MTRIYFTAETPRTQRKKEENSASTVWVRSARRSGAALFHLQINTPLRVLLRTVSTF